MSRFKDHPSFYDHPICLSETDKQSPMEVVKGFFADYRLSELRDIQDQIQKVCLTTDDGVFGKAESRSNLLSYNEKLIRLLEAASYLQDWFVPLANEVKKEILPKLKAPVKNFDIRVSNLVKGINDVAVDVSKLCVVIVHAWAAKAHADLEMQRPSSKRTAPQPQNSYVDLDRLHSMALTLQGKLTNLAGIAVDILINDLYKH